MIQHHSNIIQIKAVANYLRDLKDHVVFVGGSTVSLYASRRTPDIRPTEDVDIIVELLNYSAWTDFEKNLRALNFENDMESDVLCRYRIQGLVVDIMSTTSASMGFTNKWYQSGFINAVKFCIDADCCIKILTPPYFIATKLEAFKHRGNGDGRTSQDFEDIVFILENREELIDEFNQTDDELKKYLKIEFRKLIEYPYIEEWMDCHVERGTRPATRRILEKLAAWVEE